MKITTESITPKLAAQWLSENNNHNRPIRTGHVNRLAEDMREGRWNEDGSPFRFNVNGVLMDGQHRLHAIVKSGETVRNCVVIRGLPEDSFHTIDTGAKRSLSDVLNISGEKNHHTVSGALVLLCEFLLTNKLGANGISYSTQQLLETLEACPAIRESARIVSAARGRAKSISISHKSLLPPSASVALHYLFNEKDSALAEVFVDGMATGYNNATHAAFHMLRERLVGNRMNTARLSKEYICAVAIKAWNSERTKKPLNHLRWSDADAFPAIR